MMTHAAVKQEKESTGTKLAVVLVRGLVNTHRTVKHTCEMLHLHTRLSCQIVDDTPENRGMLVKVKDVATYGPISAETEKALQKTKKKNNYRLHPPRGGFERGGIKKPWTRGGALGERDELDTLLSKMLP